MTTKSQFTSILIATSWLWASSVCSRQAMSQSPQSQPHASQRYAPSRPVSLPHLYWHFLIYQHHLDQLALEHEKQGKDGTWLRSYLQIKLSITAEEFQPIRESADRLDSAISALSAQAKEIAAAANSARSNPNPQPADAPHYEHRLKKLTSEREDAINKEIETLNAALGPETAQKLQNYLESTFSKNVSIVHAQPDQGQNRPFGPATKASKVQP